METILKTNKVTKETLSAIKEARKSSKIEGVTSKGFRFIKTLTQLIIL
jgi:hypothetical protein